MDKDVVMEIARAMARLGIKPTKKNGRACMYLRDMVYVALNQVGNTTMIDLAEYVATMRFTTRRYVLKCTRAMLRPLGYTVLEAVTEIEGLVNESIKNRMP